MAGNEKSKPPRVPETASRTVEVRAALQYRKFDTTYLRQIEGDAFERNALPVTVIASDRVSLPVAGGPAVDAATDTGIAAWERWNDYGIGLLRKGGAGELRQADHVAFREVPSEELEALRGEASPSALPGHCVRLVGWLMALVAQARRSQTTLNPHQE